MNNELEMEIVNVLGAVVQEEIPDFVETVDRDKELTEYGFDSVNIIMAIVEIENKFNIVFDDEALTLEYIRTTHQLIEYVKEKCEN